MLLVGFLLVAIRAHRILFVGSRGDIDGYRNMLSTYAASLDSELIFETPAEASSSVLLSSPKTVAVVILANVSLFPETFLKALLAYAQDENGFRGIIHLQPTSLTHKILGDGVLNATEKSVLFFENATNSTVNNSVIKLSGAHPDLNFPSAEGESVKEFHIKETLAIVSQHPTTESVVFPHQLLRFSAPVYLSHTSEPYVSKSTWRKAQNGIIMGPLFAYTTGNSMNIVFGFNPLLSCTTTLRSKETNVSRVVSDCHPLVLGALRLILTRKTASLQPLSAPLFTCTIIRDFGSPFVILNKDAANEMYDVSPSGFVVYSADNRRMCFLTKEKDNRCYLTGKNYSSCEGIRVFTSLSHGFTPIYVFPADGPENSAQEYVDWSTMSLDERAAKIFDEVDGNTADKLSLGKFKNITSLLEKMVQSYERKQKIKEIYDKLPEEARSKMDINKFGKFAEALASLIAKGIETNFTIPGTNISLRDKLRNNSAEELPDHNTLNIIDESNGSLINERASKELYSVRRPSILPKGTEKGFFMLVALGFIFYILTLVEKYTQEYEVLKKKAATRYVTENKRLHSYQKEITQYPHDQATRMGKKND